MSRPWQRILPFIAALLLASLLLPLLVSRDDRTERRSLPSSTRSPRRLENRAVDARRQLANSAQVNAPAPAPITPNRAEAAKDQARLELKLLSPSGWKAYARCRLTTQSSSLEQDLELDPRGETAFARDLPAGPVAIRIEAPGVQTATRSLKLKAGEHEAITLRLRRGEGFWMTFIDDETGQPIQGAKASCAPRGTGRLLFQRQVSDERGRVFLAYPRPGAIWLNWSCPQYRSIAVAGQRSDTWHLDIAVSAEHFKEGLTARLQRGLSIRGEVIGDFGKPIASAKVAVCRGSRHAPLVSGPVKTDAEGRFRVAGLSPDSYRILAWKGSKVSALVELEVARGSASHIQLELERGAIITGRVTDQSGRPIPGARVSASGFPGAESRAPQARTDAGGVYRLEGLSLGALGLVAQAPGFAARGIKRFQLTTAEDRADFELAAGGTIAGRFVDDRGRPLRVRVEQVTARWGRRGLRRRSPGSFAMAASDDEGRFRFEGLLKGRHRIGARVRGFHVEEARADTGDLGIRLTLRRLVYRKLSGRVVIAAGQAMPSTLFIDPTTEPRGTYGIKGGAALQADGSFEYRFISEAPLKEVAFAAEGFLPTRLPFAPAPLDQPLVVEVALRTAASFEGRVVNEAGDPAVGATVLIWRQQQLIGLQEIKAEGAYERGGLEGSELIIDVFSASSGLDLDVLFRDTPVRERLPAPQASYTLSLADGERREGLVFRVPGR